MKKVLAIRTRSEAETRKVAEVFAGEILGIKTKQAVVVGLEGELGAGKTVFAKGFAKGLGIKEEMKSPTFILMRVFSIPPEGDTISFPGRRSYLRFFHIDAWRDQFDFREFLKSPKNILLVEWSDKTKKFLPKNYFRFVLRSPTSKGSRTSREIILYA